MKKSLKEQHLFEKKIFSLYYSKVLTVTFDQFRASLLNNIINLFLKSFTLFLLCSSPS